MNDLLTYQLNNKQTYKETQKNETVELLDQLQWDILAAVGGLTVKPSS